MNTFKKIGAVFFSTALLFVGQATVFAQNKQNMNLPQLGKNAVHAVVAAMTLKEKAKLVVGMGFRLPKSPPGKDSIKLPAGFKLPPMDPEATKIPEKVPGAAGRTHPVPQLGIPSITMSDGPAGVRIPPIRNNDSSKTYFATAFPVSSLLSATWDTTEVKKVGLALGSEAHAYGIDIMLLPAMDIQRNPLDGRDFEYYSEDPLVSGEIAAAMVRGVQSNGVGTSIKHFVANNQETSRNSINEIIGERALREIYLKGYKIAIKESHPWTVMSSYNKVNGTYTSQRKDLLTTILRKEWGFKGFVMTDWFGGKDPVAQMRAGNDLLMPGTPVQSKKIIAAVKDGNLSMNILNHNVTRILNIILKTPEFKDYKFSNKPDLKKDEAVSRHAATQGMVLLKDNNNALPFKGIKSIALFGNSSYKTIPGGTGSGTVNTAFIISLNQGLIHAGYALDQSLQTGYKNYLAKEEDLLPKPTSILQQPPHIPEMPVHTEQVNQAVKENNIALITIGRESGEGTDRELTNDFNLSQREKDLIKNVSKVFHAQGKKVIVVLNTGGAIEVASWRDEVDGILLAWQPGQEAGNAIADIVSGKVDPSGKLPETFPVKYNDVPSAKYFPGTPKDKPEKVIYKKGIYVGYRYYNTFHVKAAYPFGYGLSYTHFNYHDLKLSSAQFKNKITATVAITNKGAVPGKEVVELYLSAPATALKKPEEELKAFGKTKLLQPGETETMHFTLNAASLASLNPKQESWVAEKGKYEVKAGASSTDIRQSASFALGKNLLVEHDQN